MGFLSNIFGKKEPAVEMEPTAEMMDENQYWELVARSLSGSGGDQDAQLASLREMLEELEPEDWMTRVAGPRVRVSRPGELEGFRGVATPVRESGQGFIRRW
jgi:hypothetical protein